MHASIHILPSQQSVSLVRLPSFATEHQADAVLAQMHAFHFISQPVSQSVESIFEMAFCLP